MIRNLKALGLALIAVFAMSAIAASAASANEFHSSQENTQLTGKTTENHKFLYETGGNIVECTGGTFNGTILGKKTTKEVTVSPVYTGCTVPAVFNSPVHIDFTGCTYRFTINAAENKGPAHLICPAGAKIDITVTIPLLADCTLTVGPQTPAGTTDYSNEGTTPKRSVVVQPTQTGIVGSRDGNSLCGEATSTTGTYTGKATVEGEKNGTKEQADVWVE
ncbi:MAG TPA: hypothetical protein VEW07_07810 [Solirubrobacterales bacterium]|nr:hypothetical protein [Solirubrobacterales bacterium]